MMELNAIIMVEMSYKHLEGKEKRWNLLDNTILLEYCSDSYQRVKIDSENVSSGSSGVS